ncbi:zinc ribbon domain-containing protein [bacterium]|nr:zinc ribbon domain-containing protein [bacterium]
MPTYEYVCGRCQRPFEVQASLGEYSKGLKPTCPHCGASKALRTFTAVNVLVGQRAGGGPPRSGGPCCSGGGPCR